MFNLFEKENFQHDLLLIVTIGIFVLLTEGFGSQGGGSSETVIID